MHNLSTDLASASAAETAAASAALAASRNAERLEKKLADFNALQAEHEALKEAYQAQSTQASEVAQAYEQLHAAYTSEEQLYKDAVARIQVLEQTAAGKLVPKEGEASEGKSNETEPEKRESLLDDLLDVTEPPSETSELPLPGTEHPPETPPNQLSSKGTSPGTLGQKRLSFTHPNYAALLQSHPPPQAARPFVADVQDAMYVNFQFFQLVAVSSSIASGVLAGVRCTGTDSAADTATLRGSDGEANPRESVRSLARRTD